MPIYEYRCTGCGHKLESLQKLSEARLVTCPQCGKDLLTKLVSAAGFQLKGSGWYATDFKNSGSKPKSTAKPEGATDSAKPESGPTPSEAGGAKPDAPAVSKPAATAPDSGGSGSSSS